MSCNWEISYNCSVEWDEDSEWWEYSIHLISINPMFWDIFRMKIKSLNNPNNANLFQQARDWIRNIEYQRRLKHGNVIFSR